MIQDAPLIVFEDVGGAPVRIGEIIQVRVGDVGEELFFPGAAWSA